MALEMSTEPTLLKDVDHSDLEDMWFDPQTMARTTNIYDNIVIPAKEEGGLAVQNYERGLGAGLEGSHTSYVMVDNNGKRNHFRFVFAPGEVGNRPDFTNRCFILRLAMRTK
jgi:hypothetical protein